MPQVQSKFKNPDKFIEQLKDRIKWAEDRADRLEGKWTGHVDRNLITLCHKEHYLGKLRPGQEIKLLSYVKEVRMTEQGTWVDISPWGVRRSD